MARFEWQTEEEGDWGETVRSGDSEQPRRRLLPLVILALLVLAAGALAVYRTLERRVEDAASGMEEQVLASHEVVRYAAEQRDRELLTSFLSGRDGEWARAQEQLVQAGALFDRRGLGLRLLPAGAPETAGDGRLRVKEVSLSPDLTAADVLVEQAFAVGVGHGLTETVWLEQSGVYRQGPNRWLYAPHEDEAGYWGPWSTIDGRFVTLAFPERDALFARRLAGELEGRLAELCNLYELTCPAGYHLDVRLDGDPTTLLTADEPSPLSVVGEDGEVRLPAPTLVGRPVDDAAYRALARAYAAHVLGVALTRDLWQWACCEHTLLYRAILDEQLRRLGVQAHPLFPADYEQLARGRFGLFEDLENVWREPRFLIGGGLGFGAQAIVAFVVEQNPETSPTSMLSAMDAASVGRQWLPDVLGEEVEMESLEREWLSFLYGRAEQGVAAPPIPWPQQQGLLLCGAPAAANKRLYRYDPASNRLTEALPGRGFSALQPFPNRSGALLFETEAAGAERNILLSLWQDEEPLPLDLIPLWNSEETNVSLTYNGSALDPAGERMTLSVQGREGETNVVLDLQACLDGECHARVLRGSLIWSPDGARSLLVQGNDLLLADGDGRSPRTLITGTIDAPFWLDNDTVAYLRGEPDSTGSTMLLALDVGDGRQGGQDDAEPRMLLHVDDLKPQLPADAGALRLNRAQPNPADRDHILLTFFDARGEQSADRAGSTYAVYYNWKSGTPAQPLAVHASWTPAEFSPDGRWLAAHGYEAEVDGNVLGLMRPGSEAVMHLPQHGWPHAIRWSPDGRWLLNASGGVVRMVAPEAGFQRVLVHELVNCETVAWVEPAAE